MALPINSGQSGQIYQNAPQTGNWDWLFGTSGQTISNLDPLQQLLQQYIGQTGQQNTQNPYAGFEPIQQSAISNFNQQIIPGLTTMFSGSGNNAISSPQLQTNLSSAGAGLAERLAAMRSEFGQRNQELGLRQTQQALTPHLNYAQRQPGFGENLLMKLIGIAPDAYSAYKTGQSNDKLTEILGKLAAGG